MDVATRIGNTEYGFQLGVVFSFLLANIRSVRLTAFIGRYNLDE